MSEHAANTWTRGFVAIADVVGFSEREGPEHLRIVNHLNASLLAGLADLHLRAGQYALNFTGDGFVLAVPHEAHVRPEELLNFAESIVSGCQRFVPDAEQPALHVRMGIHAGPFHFPVPVFGSDQVVGVAPNWCARVVSVAGPTQIIVSEAFFSDLAESIGKKKAAAYFQPGDAPMDIPVKHGRMLEARLRHGRGFSIDLSPRLLRLQEAHAYLEGELRLIVNSAGNFLERLRGRRSIAPERSRPRITLWAVHDGVLEPTAYRYAFGHLNSQPGSGTRYALNPPQGPIARCLQTRASTSLTGLPNHRQDPEGYVRALIAENLTTQQIEQFSFKSRAFIGVPCALGPQSAPALALCLDFADPLTGLDSVINELMHGVESRAPRVAALWTLRTA